MPSRVVLGMFGGGSWLPKYADNPLLEQGACGGAVQHHLYEQGESKPLGSGPGFPFKNRYLQCCREKVKRFIPAGGVRVSRDGLTPEKRGQESPPCLPAVGVQRVDLAAPARDTGLGGNLRFPLPFPTFASAHSVLWLAQRPTCSRGSMPEHTHGAFACACGRAAAAFL